MREREDARRHKMNLRGKQKTEHKDGETGGGSGRGSFIPLSYIDDINSVRVGKPKPMDEVLEQMATRYKLKWDRSKDWKNRVHLGVDMNEKRHWKYRVGRATAAFNAIRRLTRLPPGEKRKVVIGQLLPILTYGSELHHKPTEEGSGLAARFARWIAMGYQGSSRSKIEDITGIGQLATLTHQRRVV